MSALSTVSAICTSTRCNPIPSARRVGARKLTLFQNSPHEWDFGDSLLQADELGVESSLHQAVQVELMLELHSVLYEGTANIVSIFDHPSVHSNRKML
jgi:hypothetical protein